MSDNETEQQIGRAYHELTKAEANLACLEKKFSSFKAGMKDLLERAEPGMEVIRSQDRIEQIGSVATDIRFMTAIEFESLTNAIKDTRAC